MAVRNPPRRMPAPRFLSTVISSEKDANHSAINHSNRNKPVARNAENTTTSMPGPLPIFAPAKQNVEPRSAPLAAQEAE